MGEDRQGQAAERYRRLVALYRRSDGSEWGGQDLERATGGTITRSYVSNLKNVRIGNPGLAKLEAIAKAISFPPALRFADTEEKAPEEALAASLKDETARELLQEVVRMAPRDRRLLLGIAGQIARPEADRKGDRPTSAWGHEGERHAGRRIFIRDRNTLCRPSCFLLGRV